MNIHNMLLKIQEQINADSGLDLRRDYIGMSKLGNCPRSIVLEYKNGIVPSEESHRMSYAGYQQENAIILMLIRAGLAKAHKQELVASFDPRIKGHIDALTTWGDLLEVKAVNTEKYKRIETQRKLPFTTFCQVQSYMHFGGWTCAYVVIRCRETYEHLIFQIPYAVRKGMELEQVARDVLVAIDSNTLPLCTCGRCKS